MNSGTEHANRALNAALSLGVPKNAVIYFAVDFDATDSEISKNIIPILQQLEIQNVRLL